MHLTASKQQEHGLNLFWGDGIENINIALERQRELIPAHLRRDQGLGITQMARIRRPFRLHPLVIHGPNPVLLHTVADAATAVIRIVVLLQGLRVGGSDQLSVTATGTIDVGREGRGRQGLVVGRRYMDVVARVLAHPWISLAGSNPPQPSKFW